jgi:hypothetical protein
MPTSEYVPNRTCEAIRKQLNIDFLVATNRGGIVATIESFWSVFFCPDN